MGAPELATKRLRLRHWRDDDRAPFAALNADAEVMEHFPAQLTRSQSDALADRCASGLAQDSFGLWAVEIAATGEFVGFTGLSVPTFGAHFTPAVEVGWRLARHAWGNGYATEAARASLAYGFGQVGLTEIVSFTTARNARSRAVMERVGMSREPGDDFSHPRFPEGHSLCPHVLYRLTADRWQAMASVPS